MPERSLPDVNAQRPNPLTLRSALIALFLLIYHAILRKVVTCNCRPTIRFTGVIIKKRQSKNC